MPSIRATRPNGRYLDHDEPHTEWLQKVDAVLDHMRGTSTPVSVTLHWSDGPVTFTRTPDTAEGLLRELLRFSANGETAPVGFWDRVREVIRK